MTVALLAVLSFPSTPGADARAQAPSQFTKVFSPNEIGPGAVSTLIFTIENPEPWPINTIGFTDDLPAGLTIASPAIVVSECGGTLTAPAAGTTITLTDGDLGIGASCTISVDVTASTPAVYSNLTSQLTYELACTYNQTLLGCVDGPPQEQPYLMAFDDLTVTAALPGFSKAFFPASVSLGDTSTLTLTIDNTAKGSVPVASMNFVDNLPLGMEIASPANAFTNCGGAVGPPTLTAVAGTNEISFSASGLATFPALDAGATCTVSVDVVTTSAGMLDNSAGPLSISYEGDFGAFVDAGMANATLEVTVTPLAIAKTFLDDPVPPGGTVELEFTLDNFDRTNAATAVAFEDVLPAGITFTSLLSNDCGGTVAGVGTTAVGLTGGTIAVEGSCTIRVLLTVPDDTRPGSYTNRTGAITGTVDGSSVEGNVATADVFIEPIPTLTKTFLEPVVQAGDTVSIEFTITNTSLLGDATDITFTDELTDSSGGNDGAPYGGFALAYPVTVTLPANGFCGPGSSASVFEPGTERQALQVVGGTLPASGMCTFTVDVVIPAGMAPGTYTNTTGPISATVPESVESSFTVTGNPASADLIVVSAPQLTKAFTDDPVGPGGTVTLEFTLEHTEGLTGDATDISFTDDLTDFVPALPGLTASIPSGEPCGVGSSLTDVSGVLTFTGGTLATGETCTFSVSISLPPGTPSGDYDNKTSDVTATVDGLAVKSQPAEDTLSVQSLAFTKEFLPPTVIAGQETTLKFTIRNLHPTDDATISFFSDDLGSTTGALEGLTATGAISNTCGGMSLLAFPTSLFFYTGGSVPAGGSCTIELNVLVPVTAEDGTYTNRTSVLSATSGGDSPTPITAKAATAEFEVRSDLLQLTKSFLDDPVRPGEPVTLEFVLTNLHPTDAASAVAFTDNLEATLPGLEATGALQNDCGGSAVGMPAAFPTDVFDYAGGSLSAGASCSIVLTLDVPAGAADGVYPNTTSPVTGTIDGFAVTGSPATDDLVVQDLQLLFSKAFDGPSTATGFPDLRFTIANPSTAATATGIVFSDNLDDVLSGLRVSGWQTVPCGPGSSISLSGTGSFTMSGGTLAPGESCVFDVGLRVPATATVGTYSNVTSQLFASGVLVAEPATADLVIEPPPTFAKAFAPDTIAAGSTSTLTFTIDNTDSAVDAEGLFFFDFLPGGVAVAMPANESTTCAGGNIIFVPPITSVIWFMDGTVAAGSSCTVQVDVTSTTGGVYNNVSGELLSSSGNSGTASATLTVEESDLSISISDSADPILTESTLTYTVTVDNAGPADASDVVVTDTLPAGVTLVSTSGCAEDAAGVPTCSLGTIASGSTASFDIEVTLDPGTLGVITNEASVTSSTTDSDPSNNTASEDTTVTDFVADLAISISDSADPILTQSTLIYTVTVDNLGPNDATDVVVTNTLPAGVTFQSTTGCAEDPTGVPTCSLGTIAGGSSASFTIEVTLDPGTLGTITSTASVTSPIADPNTDNNTASEDTIVTDFIADLSLDIADSADPVIAGQTLVYTLTVANAGPDVAENVSVTDTLPAGVTLESTSGCTNDPDGVPVCELGDIAAGTSAVYTITVRVDRTTVGVITNAATVESDSALIGSSDLLPAGFTISAAAVDPAPTNNSATEDTTVIGLGTIIIAERTNPPGTVGEFSFTASGGLTPDSFVLSDGDTQVFTGVAPGAYTVTELTPDPKFYLQTIQCENRPDSTTDRSTGTATIQIDYEEVVTCTFRNILRASGSAGVLGGQAPAAALPVAAPVNPAVPAVPATPPGGGGLALTGASSLDLFRLGALLIASGAFTLGGARRRKRLT